MNTTLRSIALALTLMAGGAYGQQITLKEAVQKAMLSNPEVLARWHTFRAAEEEVEVQRGQFFPRVDANAGFGQQRFSEIRSSGDKKTWNRSTGGLEFRQMIFDGFATANQVKRLGKAKLTRYYELLDASEATALEVTRAYYDVIKYRMFLALAEDAYVLHRATYEQLSQRTQQGVGRRVDLDQAASRLALAESNLATESANLHDVSARYQRLIGEAPPRVMYGPNGLTSGMPRQVGDALQTAFQSNPAMRAAIENIEAAYFELEAIRGAFYPRVDVKGSVSTNSNYFGGDYRRNDGVLEAVMSYNLFNGGSDVARARQFTERKNVALSQREKSCRDIRQTLAIAYNDTSRLREVLTHVENQVTLLERTRDAYRDQYNIGQRSLLDLLDTENELLNARRAMVANDVDLSFAYLRTYAGMGKLIEFLGLKKRLEGQDDPTINEPSSISLNEMCPAEAPIVVGSDRAALNQRALALLEANRDPMLAPPPPPVVPLPAATDPKAKTSGMKRAPANKDIMLR